VDEIFNRNSKSNLIIRRSVKKVFNILNLEIKRARYPRAVITDANLFNTPENWDTGFSSKKFTARYLNYEKLAFYKIILDFMDKNINFENQVIADVGCGPGILLRCLLKRNPSIKEARGYDYAPEALSVSNRVLPDVDFRVLDLSRHLEGKLWRKANIIICTEVLEHLQNPALGLQNLINMSDDLVFITVPNGRRDTWEGHIWYWSPESWKIFLKNELGKDHYLSYLAGDFTNTPNGNNWAIIKRTNEGGSQFL
jgi:2-polyprenyl-3-methyl-5-hydroxy-6-metoxy-1,4-benzoquinol methylase